jgi:hypothetical protein
MWVGSVLFAMLFIANWYWSDAPATPAKQDASTPTQTPPVNSTILRIHSARKWPDKVVFDTNIPTITAPPPPVVTAETAPLEPVAVAAAAVPSSLDAHAESKQVAQPAPPPKRQAKVHHRNARPADSTWAAANPNQPTWSSWSNSPHWSWNW